jgi:hypothetical protein
MTSDRRGFFALAAGLFVGGGVGLSAEQQAPVTLAEVEQHIRDAALAPPPAPGESCPSGPRRVQTYISFTPPEPRGGEALQGWNTPDFSLPGAAASASGKHLMFGWELAPVVLGFWNVIWDPRGDTRSALRLVEIWNPPQRELGRVTNATGYNGPCCAGAYITASLQELQRLKLQCFVVQHLRANPIIYESTLQIIWDLA